MANFTYDIDLKLDEKGFLRAVNRATGETQDLDDALNDVTKSSKEMGNTGNKAGLALAAGMGVALGATALLVKGIKELTVASIKSAAEFETARVRLETFTGSASSARAEMQRLTQFAANTPFQLPGILDTQIQLLAFGGETLATAENLQLVGDAAAAVGQPINEIGNWFGRAYSAIQEGKPLGEVFNRLRELGLSVPGVSDQITELQKVGASSTEVWKVFAEQFEKTEGSMVRMSNTFDGKVSTMIDNWNLLLGRIGDSGPLAVAKTGIDEILKSLEFLNDSGDVTTQIGFEIANGMIIATEATLNLVVAMLEITKPLIAIMNINDRIDLFKRDAMLEVLKVFARINLVVAKIISAFSDFINDVPGHLDSLVTDAEKRVDAFTTAQQINSAIQEKSEQDQLAFYSRVNSLLAGTVALKDTLIPRLEKENELIREKNRLEGSDIPPHEKKLKEIEPLTFLRDGSLTGEINNLNEATKSLSEQGLLLMNERMAETELAMAGLDQLSGDLQSSMADSFMGIIDGSLSAQDAIKNMYKSMLNSFARFLSERLTKMLIGDKLEDFLAKKRIARNNIESASNTGKASTGFFAAHAGIKFVGLAIALAFIARMMSELQKSKQQGRAVTAFATGGIINPVPGGQLILAGEAGSREVIAPETDFVDFANQLTDGSSDSNSAKINVYGNIYGEDDFTNMTKRSIRALDLAASR